MTAGSAAAGVSVDARPAPHEVIQGLIAQALAKTLNGREPGVLQFTELGAALKKLDSAGVVYRTESRAADYGRQSKNVLVVEWEIEVK